METAYDLDIGGRGEQQDSCGVFSTHHSTLLVLGDGMGGHKGGAVASKTLLDHAKRAYDIEVGYIDNPKDFLQSIIDDTSEALRLYREDYSDTDPQTTCVLVLIQDSIVHSMHIGDSRVYIFDNSEYQWRTKDHSVVQMLLNLGEITEEEMATHPDQNKLLKSLNAKKSVEGTYKSNSLPSEHCMILACSDGFWEYISVEEMRKYGFGMELKSSLSKMILLAKDRGGVEGDNISVAVALVNSSLKAPLKKDRTNSKLFGVIVFLLGIIAFLIYIKYNSNIIKPLDKNIIIEDAIVLDKNNTLKTTKIKKPIKEEKIIVIEKPPIKAKEIIKEEKKIIKKEKIVNKPIVTKDTEQITKTKIEEKVEKKLKDKKHISYSPILSKEPDANIKENNPIIDSIDNVNYDANSIKNNNIFVQDSKDGGMF